MSEHGNIATPMIRARLPHGQAASCRLLLCLAAPGCTDAPMEHELEELFTGWSDVHPEPAVSDSTWEAVVLREYGSLTGEISFGLVAGATIRHDGSLVVVDLADCSLVVIDRPAGTLRSRLGGCGQGPGEFTSPIRAVGTAADSLFVYEHGGAHIVVLDSIGVETRRIPVLIPGESIGTISHLEVLDDSTLLVAREFVGRATVETIDRDTGDPRDVLVELLAKGIYEDWIRHLAACVQPSTRDPTIVALNEWVFEGVGLSANTRTERFHFLTSFADLRDDGEGGTTSADVRCGSSVALFRGTTPGGPSETTETGIVFQRAGAVVLEARAYDGTLRMRKIIRDKESPLRGGVGAIAGDTVFFISNRTRDHPVVAEVLLRLRQLNRKRNKRRGQVAQNKQVSKCERRTQ